MKPDLCFVPVRKFWASLLAAFLLFPMPASRSQDKGFAVESLSSVGSPSGVQGLTEGDPVGGGSLQPPSSGIVRDIEKSAWLKPIDMERGELTLVSGRSQLIRLERTIARVSVSNPAIVDAVIITPNEILLNAKAEGAVNVIFWDHQNRVSVYDITVTRDPNLLQAVLDKIAPESNLEVFPSNDVYVVKGDVDSVAKQKEVEQAANAFAEGSVSLVRVTDAKQILLKTRFIQLDHTQDYDFGLDVQYLGKHFGPLVRPGGTGATLDEDSPFTPRDSVVSYNTLSTVPSASGVHWFPYYTRDRGINTFIKAIETKGIGKIIARPNLLASDGQEASFLVGGEAAVVAISNDNVGVQYKEFGTRLTFTPEVLPSGRIRLTVAPEVSALDFANGVSVNNVTIPSFTTVRTKTVVELDDQETFMVGGLLQQKLTIDERGVPFLRRMPVIGKLFDNTNNSYSDSELLVVVTPIIVNPLQQPLSDDNDADGLIEQASKMQPYRVKDENMQAIDKYLRQSREELQGEIKKFQESRQSVKTAPPPSAPVKKESAEPIPQKQPSSPAASAPVSSPAPDKSAAAFEIQAPPPLKAPPVTQVRMPSAAESKSSAAPVKNPDSMKEPKKAPASSPVTQKNTPGSASAGGTIAVRPQSPGGAAAPVSSNAASSARQAAAAEKPKAVSAPAAQPGPSPSLEALEAELGWEEPVTQSKINPADSKNGGSAVSSNANSSQGNPA